MPPFHGQRRSSRKPPEPTKDEDKPDCVRKTRWRRPPSRFDTILYATDFTSLYRPKTSDESQSRGDAHERICYLLSVICHFIRAQGSNEPRLVAGSNACVPYAIVAESPVNRRARRSEAFAVHAGFNRDIADSIQHEMFDRRTLPILQAGCICYCNVLALTAHRKLFSEFFRPHSLYDQIFLFPARARHRAYRLPRSR